MSDSISIDLRSDTVTRPTSAMRKAMAEAEVGDDVYKDDPTVNRLEQIAAEMSGKETALFFPSGTQSNLCALLAHCQRGEEYICGQQAHTYKYEAGGGAVLGSIQPQPLEHDADGSIPIEKIEACIKPDDMHFPMTRLICLENTIGGQAIPISYMQKVAELAKKYRLNMHLDGARIFNAATALNVSAKEVGDVFDSISICLSKGLCAPVGSLLCGSEELIQKAKRIRKMTGGGMRQSGILAAAGIIALETMTKRLREDHEHAEFFANLLKSKTSLNPDSRTNIVIVSFSSDQAAKIRAAFKDQGIQASVGLKTRFVFHHDIRKEDIPFLVDVIANALKE